MKLTSILVAFLLLFSSALAAQTQPATANNELNLGVQAYRQAKYEDAIQHFEKVVALAPEKMVGHLYLATAYVSQYMPGLDTPENTRLAEKAIDQYQIVLDASPARDSKINGAKGIAYLYLNMKKYNDSKKYYRMASDMDPGDPEPYYSVGVIDWTECYQPRMEARGKLGLAPGDNLDPSNKNQRRVCAELKARNTSLIEEGIDSLNQAIKFRPDYDDAMAYMNLMYREKADVECDDLAARARDLRNADDWVDKTLATKKAKADKNSPTTAPNPQ